MKHPDPTGHLMISLVKSIFRIGAGFELMFYGNPLHIGIAGFLLIFAEVLGIIEELV